MAQTLEQLGQLRPADTTAASLFSPTSGEVLVMSVIVANTSGSDATFRLFHDDDGTTYDETTALAWDVSVPAGSVATVELNIMMDDASGNLAVRSSSGNAFNFTCYGSVVS